MKKIFDIVNNLQVSPFKGRFRGGFWALALALALTGCSNDTFDGDKSLKAQNDSIAICFGSDNQATTRGTARNLESYEGTMMVYALKYNPSSSQYVRALNRYAIWNTSNDPTITGSWDYVGFKGDTKTVIKDGKAGEADNFTVLQNQVIKFWDYSADHYMFWAWAPYNDHYMDNEAKGSIKPNMYTTKGAYNYDMIRDAYLQDIDGHLTANNTSTKPTYYKFYVSNPVLINKEDYASYTSTNPVTFTFGEFHAKVRVAFYETISDYKIIGIKFYDNQSTPVAGNNIVFNRTDEAFVGGKSGTDRQYAKVSYDNTNLSYTFLYKYLTSQKWIQFGKLDLSDASPMADGSKSYLPSWGTDGDMSSDYYFTVLPTPSELVDAAPFTLKCDITLKAEDGSGEEIEVTGITATVPKSFSSWKPNHAYSYIFKFTKACLDLKTIEFDAEASSILDYSTDHEEEMK